MKNVIIVGLFVFVTSMPWIYRMARISHVLGGAYRQGWRNTFYYCLTFLAVHSHIFWVLHQKVDNFWLGAAVLGMLWFGGTFLIWWVEKRTLDVKLIDDCESDREPWEDWIFFILVPLLGAIVFVGSLIKILIF